MIGIYAIRNTKNGKMYIGESIDIEKRWKNHQEHLYNGNHHSYKLQSEWDKSRNNQFRFFVLLLIIIVSLESDVSVINSIMRLMSNDSLNNH